MSRTTTTASTTTAADPANPAGGATMTAREIFLDITSRCRSAKLSAEQTLAVVDQADGNIQAATDLIINMMADRDPQPHYTPTGGSMRSGDVHTLENPAFAARAVTDALYARMSGKAVEGAAAELVGHTVTSLGRIVLQAAGCRDPRLNGSAEQIATLMFDGRARMEAGMHGTADFPGLMGGAANRFLLDAYQAAESDALRLARVRNVNRLDDVKVLRLSEMPTLDLNPESAEVRYGTRGEDLLTAYHTETYAKLFALTRRAIINDDLNAFVDILSEFGRAAARTKADVLFRMLAQNDGNGPKIDDGKPIFHTTRKNLMTGSALDVANLDTARTMIRTTKGLDGVTPLNLRAKYLLVGPELESRAEIVMAELSPTRVEDVNPNSKKLEVLVDARIEDDQWFVFADQRQAPVLEVSYLNGQTAPQLSTREGWSVLGQEYRAVLDFGAGFIGWRGAVRNPGLGG